MRELNLGESILPVRATPVAMFFYRQEFDSDMSHDCLQVLTWFLGAPDDDECPDREPLLDAVAGALKLVWAMGKASAWPKIWPAYGTWMDGLPDVEFDASFVNEVLCVAEDGLFVECRRGSGETGPPSERPDLEWLTVGKRAGLAFDELNQMRISDLSAYVDIIMSEPDGDRPATQAEIDAFTG
jgi:hypothetical protein